MAKFEVKGKVEAVLAVKRGVSQSGKEWALQDILIAEPERELPSGDKIQDRVLVTIDATKIAAPSIGDEVIAHCDLKASSKGERWWNNTRCWKLEESAAEAKQMPLEAKQEVKAPEQFDPYADNEGTELPF